MKKSVHFFLYILAKGIICGFEWVVLMMVLCIAYMAYDVKTAVYGVLLALIIMPIGWKIFDWPNKKKAELKKLRDIYEEEINKSDEQA